MDIICSNCGYVYKIDETIMPRLGAVSLPCRKCGAEIKIEVLSDKSESIPDETQLAPTVSLQDEAIEIFDSAKKTALIYTPDHQVFIQINRDVADKGFEARQINGVNDIRSRFTYHIYDVILLHQAKAEPDEQLKKVMTFINTLPPDVRRRIYVIYAYIGGNRLDFLKAFTFGADITISPLDFDDIGNILEKGLYSKKAFYEVFLDCLAKTSLEGAQ